METIGEIAKKWGTDWRNVLLHLTPPQGKSQREWIEYLKSLPGFREVGRQLGISRSAVARWFGVWARTHGIKKSHYLYYERRHNIPVRVYKAPPEFVDWLKERLEKRRR